MNFAIEGKEHLIEKLRKIWNDNNLKLDIPYIDLQHIWLIWILLHIESELNVIDPILKENIFRFISSELIDFTIEHFSLEEDIFKCYDYNESVIHINKHKHFAKVVEETINSSKTIDEKTISSLLTFLKDWLFNHIMTEDKKFQQYFKRKGVDLTYYFQDQFEKQEFVKANKVQTDLYEAVTKNKLVIRTAKERNIIVDVFKIWKTYNLGVNIPIVDMQHMWLIKMIVELESATKEMDNNKRDTVFKSIIMGCINYTKEHFATEEAIMIYFNLPDYETHKTIHKKFIEMIGLRNHQNKMGVQAAAMNLVLDLKQWLVTHIGIEDQKFKTHLRLQLPRLNDFVKEKVKNKEFVIHKGQLNAYHEIIQMIKVKSIE